MATSSFLRLAHLPPRGRALVASQNLLPGQIVLQESPLFLYLDAQAASSDAFCFHCTRSSPQPSPCHSCQVALFCCPTCAVAAASSSHTPFVCSALSLLVFCTLDFDSQTQARFLIAAYNLAAVSPASFEQFLSLEGEGHVDAKVHLVYTFMSEVIRSAQLECQSLPTWSLELVSSLLAKDQRNAFGIDAPALEPGKRKVKAYAVYAQASFLNHDCLPNACRFDYIDKPGIGNTDIVVRVLHAIPEGVEVCISYFPINWPRTERQKRLKEDYNFDCNCERCNVEENWSDEDITEQAEDFSVEGDRDRSEGDEEMENPDEDAMEADGNTQDNFPHAMFFVKYLCPKENCDGTMAPLPPSAGIVSSVMECNVCGHLRTEEEFLEDIDEHKVVS